MGSPILQYILGNSIITPDESNHSFQVFRDEYTLGRLYALNHQKKWQNNGANESHEVNWIDRILKLKVINSGPNFEFQSNYPSTYYSRIGRYPPNYFQGPSNYEINEINPETHKAQMRYDGVSGIKMDVCTGCLQILSAPITSKNLRFEDFHVCDPRRVDVVLNMAPEERAKDILEKFQNLPRLLFELCKDWSNNTSGEVYLSAKIDDGLKENECLNHEIQEKNSFPFLKRVLSESKITLTDTELLEFLGLAINQTKTSITVTRQPGQAKSKYLLVLSTA